MEDVFSGSGWHVLEAQVRSPAAAAFARPGGELLRRRIDEMPNEEYQTSSALAGDELRALLATAPPRTSGLLRRALSRRRRLPRRCSAIWAGTTSPTCSTPSPRPDATPTGRR